MKLTGAIAMILAAGCGGGDSTTDANGTSSSAGVGLTIASASSSTKIGGVAAGSGNEFITVAITLANTGAKVPLSTSPALFSLATDASIDYTASALAPSNACSANVSVAMGGTQSCSLAFEVPTAQKPTELLYNDVHGDTAMVAVPAVVGPSASCETFKSFPLGNSACQTCLQGASASGGACSAAGSDYASSCPTCGQMCATASDPCQCEHDCDTPACQQKFDTETMCYVTACGASCH